MSNPGDGAASRLADAQGGLRSGLTSTSSLDSVPAASRPRRANSKPYFETARHSWVFTKTPPAPEALTATSTAFFSASFELSNSSSPQESTDSIPTLASTSRRSSASNLKEVKLRDELARAQRAPSGLRTVTMATTPPSGLANKPEPPKENSIDRALLNGFDFNILSSLSISKNPPPNPPNNSQRNSMASSNRDSVASDMGYFSTSPGSEAGTKVVHQSLNKLAFISFGTNEVSKMSSRPQEFNQPAPAAAEGAPQQTVQYTEEPICCVEDGFQTARSSLYLTPLSFSPTASFSDLPRSLHSIDISPQLAHRDDGLDFHKSDNNATTSPYLSGHGSPSLEALVGSQDSLKSVLAQANKHSTKQTEPPTCGSSCATTIRQTAANPLKDSIKSHIQIKQPSSAEAPASKEPTYPPQLQRRLNIALEILKTERTYVAGLELIERVFYRPLVDAAANQGATPILDSKRISDIFSNLMGILTVNREFLSQLELRLEGGSAPWSPETDLVGDIFCQMAPYFRMYSLYVKNFNSALSVISDQMGKTPTFASFLKKKNVIEECKGLPFESYLILPVQRIPRYKLLIEDLLKRTDESHQDHANLVKGLDIVQRVATFVNETIRQHEMFMEMLKIQNSLVGYNEVLLVPGRRLIKRGSVHKICRKNHQPREFFLFTDILIYASGGNEGTLTFHRKVELEQSKVLEVEDTDLVKNSFQVISPEKSFAVYCESPEKKDAWIQSIRNTIEELLSSKRTLRLAAAVPPRKAAEVVLPQVISNYQAPVWIPDDQAENCHTCREEFTVFRRKHHCRLCGNVICHACSANTFFIPGSSLADLRPARACDICYRVKFPGVKRNSFMGSDPNGTVARFPFNAPRRLAELRDSFISRDSYCSDTSTLDEGESRQRHSLRSVDETAINSGTSTFTRLQRLRSMSGSTAAIVAGFQSAARSCQLCLSDFTVFKWKNQCQSCRKIVCSDCLSKKARKKCDSMLISSTAASSIQIASGASSLIDPSDSGLPIVAEEDSAICDPCYLGVDPAHVVINPEGGGWGVHETTSAETSATVTSLHSSVNLVENKLPIQEQQQQPDQLAQT